MANKKRIVIGITVSVMGIVGAIVAMWAFGSMAFLPKSSNTQTQEWGSKPVTFHDASGYKPENFGPKIGDPNDHHVVYNATNAYAVVYCHWLLAPSNSGFAITEEQKFNWCLEFFKANGISP